MHERLVVDKQTLDKAGSDGEYLQMVYGRYIGLWNDEPENRIANFSDAQISFFVYGMLREQVYNGGFLQLIFNGFTDMIFNSPLIDSLRDWGAQDLAVFLDSIKDRCLLVRNELELEERTPEVLSASYAKYPDFEGFDQRFYAEDGAGAIRQYVEGHLGDFIGVLS